MDRQLEYTRKHYLCFSRQSSIILALTAKDKGTVNVS